MTPRQSPLTVRLDPEHREVLDRLIGTASPSEVVRKGLRMVAASELPSDAPLYPRLVDEEAIEELLERATQAACDVLDELFPGVPPERAGIGSNFQGTLKEHMAAMLVGREAAHRGYRREINALFGDHTSFGKVRYSQAQNEGYTVLSQPLTHGGPQLFYDDDRKDFVSLELLQPGALFNDQEAAVKAAFGWLAAREISPRAMKLKLCVLSYESEGTLKLEEVAA